MSESNPNNPLPPESTDVLYLSQLRDEGADLTGQERADHEMIIDQLLGEMALKEKWQDEANEHIQRAKDYLEKPLSKEAARPKVEVDLSKIGWIQGEGVISAEAKQIVSKELEYLFVDLTTLDSVAHEARNHLVNEGEWEPLLHKLTEDSIPIMWQGVLTRKGLRPVSIGGRKINRASAQNSLNTIYSTYKLDMHGTKNRALVMVLDKQGETPIFGLAAMYDHEDTDKIHRHMYLKQK